MWKEIARVRGESSAEEEKRIARDGIMDLATKMQKRIGCKMGEWHGADLLDWICAYALNNSYIL